MLFKEHIIHILYQISIDFNKNQLTNISGNQDLVVTFTTACEFPGQLKFVYRLHIVAWHTLAALDYSSRHNQLVDVNWLE